MRILLALSIALILNLEFCFAQQTFPPPSTIAIPAANLREGINYDRAWADAELMKAGESQKALLEDKELFLGAIALIADDDEVTKLMKEKVKVSLDLVAALQARYEQGLDNIDFLLEAQKKVASSASELLRGKELIGAYRYTRNSAKLLYLRVLELQKVGMRGGDQAAVAQSKYALIDAEIKLLKEIQKQGGGNTPPVPH